MPDVSSKKRCLYRHLTYHLKAHTISNKLVTKVSAQKKWGESYDSYKYVFKFLLFRAYSPLNHVVNTVVKVVNFIHARGL